MRHILYSAFIIAAIFLASCTNRQIYESIQGSERLDCQKLPQGQYEKCMKDHDQSYDSYEKDREAVLEEKNGHQ